MFRLFLRISFVIFIVILGITVLNWYNYESNRINQAHAQGTKASAEIKHHIDSLLQLTTKWVNEISAEIESTNYSKSQLEKLVEQKSKSLPIGLGITVAFEPFMFDENIEFYAPYFDNIKQELIDIGKLYDYTDSDKKHCDWYTVIANKKEGKWSTPYFAKAADMYVVDYGIPMFSKGDPNQVKGVISFTFSLESFAKYVNSLTTGYGFVASKELELILHPRTEYMLKPELAANAMAAEPLFQRIKNEDSGHFNYYSTYSYQNSELYFSTLTNNWVICTVFSTKDLLGIATHKHNKIIDTSVIFAIVIFLGAMIVLKVESANVKRLWYLSLTLTILLLVNIILIWYLNITENNNKNGNLPIIKNHTALQQRLKVRNNELHKIGYPNSSEIRTGVFIGDVDFKDAYSVAISGKVWQKFPDSVEITHDLNFVFPQKSPTSILRTQIVSKTHIDDYWLYRYNFTTTLEFDFDYTKYPMDYRLLNIQLMYPDIHENRILVPDLNGYDILDPSTAPGVSDEIYLPNSQILSSAFSLTTTEFKSNLGNESYSGPTSAPVLEFNIIVKRNIINALIINVLPIIVIAVLIFLLYFTIHKENGELKEGSALSVIQATGGFFFVLLLAHIQLRRTLETPDLSYMETYYLVMYVAIAAMAVGILLYVKTNRFAILEYRNNIFVKLIYWPFLLMLIYSISLSTFY